MKLPLWLSALSATLLVQVVSSFAAAAVPLLGPILTLRWGLAPQDIGYVSAVISAGICWFLACGGVMLGHYGPIRTLQFGLLSVAVGLAILSQPVIAVALVGALLVGLGLAPNTPAGSQILMRAAPPEHRTLVFSIKQAGVPLDKDASREIVYGMPYDKWRERYQREASETQKTAFEVNRPKE